MYKSLLVSVVGLLVSVLPSVAVAQLFAPQASKDVAQVKPDNQCDDRDKGEDCESESTICFYFGGVPGVPLGQQRIPKGICSEVERWRFCLSAPNFDVKSNGPVFNLQSFNFTKDADNASPKLLDALVTCRPIGSVVLTVKFGKQTITYTFCNVILTNYSQAVVKECAEPLEDITFAYEYLRVQYNNGPEIFIGPKPVAGAK